MIIKMPTNDKEYQREYMREYRIKQKLGTVYLPTLPSKVVKNKVVKKHKENIESFENKSLLDLYPIQKKISDYAPDKNIQLVEIMIRMQKFNFPKKDIQLIMELM